MSLLFYTFPDLRTDLCINNDTIGTICIVYGYAIAM